MELGHRTLLHIGQSSWCDRGSEPAGVLLHPLHIRTRLPRLPTTHLPACLPALPRAGRPPLRPTEADRALPGPTVSLHLPLRQHGARDRLQPRHPDAARALRARKRMAPSAAAARKRGHRRRLPVLRILPYRGRTRGPPWLFSTRRPDCAALLGLREGGFWVFRGVGASSPQSVPDVVENGEARAHRAAHGARSASQPWPTLRTA